jgi:hypothetical protein
MNLGRRLWLYSFWVWDWLERAVDEFGPLRALKRYAARQSDSCLDHLMRRYPR